MPKTNITRATLGRLPIYLKYLQRGSDDTVSAAEIARDLGLGEVLVRRDLNLVCGEGRPKIGYPTEALIAAIEAALGTHKPESAVLVGVGGLGLALLRYKGFESYGLKIAAGFDRDRSKWNPVDPEHPILPMEEFDAYCRSREIRIGIITVPGEAAQEVCNQMVQSGIRAIWNFAPRTLAAPEHVVIKNENLALSLAHLHLTAGQ